ncbi:MAG: hypothetical protein EBT81_07200, partial [Gammaproteobacteria bacterium]|nr:hypothetical protein [Gammaproteobacteria bacterium]
MRERHAEQPRRRLTSATPGLIKQRIGKLGTRTSALRLETQEAIGAQIDAVGAFEQRLQHIDAAQPALGEPRSHLDEPELARVDLGGRKPPRLRRLRQPPSKFSRNLWCEILEQREVIAWL